MSTTAAAPTARDGGDGAAAAGGGGFHPRAFRPFLPRDLKWHFVGGEPVFEFFSHWEAARDAVVAAAAAEGGGGAAAGATPTGGGGGGGSVAVKRAAPLPPLEVFARTARRLRASGEPVDADEALLERGLLLWAPPGGVPRATRRNRR